MGGKDPYSGSKGAAEIVFGAYARSFFTAPNSCRVGTVRAGNVIGGGDFAVDRIIPDCVRAWKNREAVVIRAPKSVRPWQHVLEPLSGYLWFAAKLYGDTSEKFQNQGFNFGPSRESQRTVEELLLEIKKSWHEGEWKIDPSQVGNKKEAVLLSLNCEKAKRELQWQSLLEFSDTAKWTADWYRAWTQGQDVAKLTRDQIQKYAQIAASQKIAWAGK